MFLNWRLSLLTLKRSRQSKITILKSSQRQRNRDILRWVWVHLATLEECASSPDSLRWSSSDKPLLWLAPLPVFAWLISNVSQLTGCSFEDWVGHAAMKQLLHNDHCRTSWTPAHFAPSSHSITGVMTGLEEVIRANFGNCRLSRKKPTLPSQKVPVTHWISHLTTNQGIPRSLAGSKFYIFLSCIVMKQSTVKVLKKGYKWWSLTTWPYAG